jgi:hypothetical protein
MGSPDQNLLVPDRLHRICRFLSPQPGTPIGINSETLDSLAGETAACRGYGVYF